MSLALQAVTTWPGAFEVPHAAAALIRAGGVAVTAGPAERVFRIASVTKPLVAYAVLIGVEEGALDLEEPAGPPGATVRHLLAHTAGYAFDSDSGTITPPGTRRIYSNQGYEVLAAYFEQVTGIAVADYLTEAVLQPLGMTSTRLAGSAAYAAQSTVADLSRFAAELLRPRLLDAATVAELVAVQFPGLAGMLPGVGRYDPLDWGLGVERNFGRPGHWAGNLASPATYGHFGGAGTFLWVDPTRDLACACLTDREFGPWALRAWPELCDAVIAESDATTGPA